MEQVRVQACVVGVLDLQGASGRRPRVGHGGVAGRAAWAPALSPQWRKEELFPENPLADFNSLQKGPSADFVDLKEALNHFYKTCKNSGGLSLSSGNSTKFWVAK